VNITDAVNLAGVATDGSAVLWVNTTSGRKFSAITAISGSSGAWVVTVGVAFATTESGRTWGIGGKRATLAGSAQILQDWGLGWQVDQQTGETIAATIVVVCPAPDGATVSPSLMSTTYSGVWGTQPLIQTATASLIMFNTSTTGLAVRGLAFKSTASPAATAFQPVSVHAAKIIWSDCIFDGFNIAIDGQFAAGQHYDYCTLERCEFKNCTNNNGAAIFNDSNVNSLRVLDCYFHDNKGALFAANKCVLEGCVFTNNLTGSGTNTNAIQLQMNDLVFRCNTVYNCGCTGSNINAALGALSSTPNQITLEDNDFYGCLGYAVIVPGGYVPGSFLNRNNAYGGNNGGGTGLDRSGFAAGYNDKVLTANPFMSTSTPDWGPNNTAGGGALVRGAASTIPNATAFAAGDIGAIQHTGGGPSYFAG
jgi:hypothetical protein